MGEVFEINRNQNPKEYWDSGINAHQLLGVRKDLAEQYRIKANKIHFLFDSGILAKTDKDHHNVELFLSDDLDKEFTGTGPKFKDSQKTIELYVNALDAIERICEYGQPSSNFPEGYRSFKEITNRIRDCESEKDNLTKQEIKNTLRWVVGKGNDINLQKAA
jgi:hypothetical protein